MNVFISEYFTSGQCPNISPESSLYQEGWAMLQALLIDAQTSDHQPETLQIQCSTTLSGKISANTLPNVNVIHVANADEAQREFRKQTAAADRTIVIAPESEGILKQQFQIVEEVGGKQIGCRPAALELTSDKWKLYQHWNEHRIPTPATTLLSNYQPQASFAAPFVIKPRWGAGGEQTWQVQDSSKFNKILNQLKKKDLTQFLVQPYVIGKPCSIGILSLHDGDHLFPVCQQRIEWTDSFHYRGGELPVALPSIVNEQLHGLVAQVRQEIPSLHGYWGIDFIWNPNNLASPLAFIEINPRLTTSYIGYRQLTTTNLAQLWLHDSVLPAKQFESLAWSAKRICF